MQGQPQQSLPPRPNAAATASATATAEAAGSSRQAAAGPSSTDSQPARQSAVAVQQGAAGSPVCNVVGLAERLVHIYQQLVHVYKNGAPDMQQSMVDHFEHTLTAVSKAAGLLAVIQQQQLLTKASLDGAGNYRQAALVLPAAAVCSLLQGMHQQPVAVLQLQSDPAAEPVQLWVEPEEFRTLEEQLDKLQDKVISIRFNAGTGPQTAASVWNDAVRQHDSRPRVIHFHQVITQEGWRVRFSSSKKQDAEQGRAADVRYHALFSVAACLRVLLPELGRWSASWPVAWHLLGSDNEAVPPRASRVPIGSTSSLNRHLAQGAAISNKKPAGGKPSQSPR